MSMSRRNKYGNVKVEIDGFKFDSKKEARRYQELKLMEKAGQIDALVVHFSWPIEVNGDMICRYICDFQYLQNKELVKELVVEDAKGFRTPEYKLKRKLMKAVYGIDIVEI